MDIIQRIQQFNAGRDPERLALKYRRMREDPFIFLRASCHLFQDRLSGLGATPAAPLAWLCGDLHLENFGSYKGDNRLVYFDLNDFDEAALGPVTRELVRFLASLLVGAESLGSNQRQALDLCAAFLDGYAGALAEGKARWVERDTADGLVADLLKSARKRSRARLLDSRTELSGSKRRIRIDGVKALPASASQRSRVTAFMEDFATRQPAPRFFRPLDVARRISGNGSLGVERYIILVEGKGSPDGNYLLDLKAAQPSSLLPHLAARQPHWESEAERVVAVQRRMQAISMAFLQPVRLDGQSCVLRALQPSEDRVDLRACSGRQKRLAGLVRTMGEIVAWGQLRSSGRDGSALADALIDFGTHPVWRDELIELARLCANAVREDWATYCAAYDDGAFRSD